jgi:neutral amino acid transport system permease protein
MEGSVVGHHRDRRRRTSATLVGCLLVGLVGLAAAAAPAGAQEQPEDTPAGDLPQVTGRIRYDDETGEDVPVPDVEITVEAADGSFTETVTTDDDGAFSLELPAPGRYTATIDTDALPDGVGLADEDRTTLNVNLSPGQTQPLLFRLATGDEVGGESTLEKVPDKVFDGIRFGLVIAMCAIGLSLIFGTTGLVNFAHGDMVTFGALMAYFFNRTLDLNLLIAAPLAIVAGGLFGAVFNRGVWRPLRARGTGLVAMMIVSFGAGLALRYIFLYQFQGARRTYDGFELQPDAIDIGPISVVPRDLWIMGISIAVLVGVALFLQRTLMGKAMRAVSDDTDLAESSGVDVERVIAWVWITGGGLAALGGIFQGLDQKVQWQTGNQLLLLIFAGVILGGLGTSYGALVGSLTIGLLIQLSTLFVDTEVRNAAALLVMIVVLMVRPQGILGYAERVG